MNQDSRTEARIEEEENNLLEELKAAKENVLYLLNNGNALVDMKGLSYWAGRVERVREDIKDLL